MEHANQIGRQELGDRLLGPDAPRLTYISAMAGMGKSALLRQLGARATATDHVVARLDLVAADREPALFCHRLRTVLGIPSYEDRRAASVPNAEAAMQGLIDDVDRIGPAGAQFLLLLDDYQHARSEPFDAFLGRLFDAASQWRFIVAGRGPAGFPLRRYRQKEPVNLLQDDGLRFSAEEIDRHFGELRRVPGLNAILSLSEGWPVALSICQDLVASGDDDVETGIREELALYIQEEIVTPLTPALRSALERLSLSETIVPAAAEQLIGADVVETLGQLSGEGLIHAVSSADGDTGWRMNPLFRDIIASRWRGRDPLRHLGAVTALFDHDLKLGDWDAAAKLCADLDDKSGLWPIMERAGGWMLVARIGVDRMRLLIEGLPYDQSDHRRLKLAQVYVLARSGLLVEARRVLEDAERQIASSGAGDDLAGEIGIHRVLVDLFENHRISAAAIEGLDATAKSGNVEDPVIVASAANLLCAAHYRNGEFEKARDAGLRALTLCRHYDLPFLSAYVCTFTAMSELRLGQLDRARAILASMPRDEANPSLAASLVDVATILKACIAYESGAVGEARDILQNAYEDIVGREGWLEIGALGYSAAALIAFQDGDQARALDILSDAGRAATAMQAPQLALLARWHAVYLLLMAGQEKQAATALQRLRSQAFADEAAEEMLLTVRVMQALVEAASGLVANDVRGCIRQLDAVATPDLDADVPTRARLLCLRLSALARDGADGAELDAIILSLSGLIQDQGFLSVLIEMRRFATPALTWCLQHGVLSNEARAAATVLLQRIGTAEPDSAAASPELKLSHRQRQVLVLLGEGMTNKEIAAKLALSEGTVRAYRRNLYKRAGISRRSQAISIIRQMDPKTLV